MVSVHIITGRHLPDSRRFTFRGHNAQTLGESTPPSPMGAAAAGAQRRKARQTLETHIQQRSRRGARQSREYVLIWLLQQRLRAVSWPRCWRLRCMQPALLSHGMGLVRPGSLSRGYPSACHARFMCSAPAFCAWRRLPLICLKLLIADRRVCTRRARCFCLRISHFCSFRSASSSGLARRRFPWPASCSKLFDVAHCSLLHRRLVFWLN